jgi:two-component system phosphate regulon sensor histidine kinase PhoR
VRPKLKLIGIFVWRLLTTIVFVLAAWAAAHFGTRALYAVFGARPSETLASLVTFCSAIVLMMLTIATIGFLFRHRRHQAFTQLLESIRRIGRGEFHKPIPVEQKHAAGPFGELIDSINMMAGELSQMERLRQQFISNVSHEFQSPLTSIGGFARALRNEELSAEDRTRYLDIIEKECARLSRLSDNLLKLTSLESEHQVVHPKPYRLDRQLRSIVLSVEPQWAGKGLDVEADLEELTVTADEELLSQVWINLLHNSIKFTPPGGSIRLAAAADDAGGVRVAVSDTGIGMSEEEQAHVFERFYKADQARGREAGGSGLGLAIVKTIVDLHKGTVTVASAPGQGATFTVTLPLVTPAADPVDSRSGSNGTSKKDAASS